MDEMPTMKSKTSEVVEEWQEDQLSLSDDDEIAWLEEREKELSEELQIALNDEAACQQELEALLTEMQKELQPLEAEEALLLRETEALQKEIAEKHDQLNKLGWREKTKDDSDIQGKYGAVKGQRSGMVAILTFHSAYNAVKDLAKETERRSKREFQDLE